jgi:hypothetical protein
MLTTAARLGGEPFRRTPVWIRRMTHYGGAPPKVDSKKGPRQTDEDLSGAGHDQRNLFFGCLFNRCS